MPVQRILHAFNLPESVISINAKANTLKPSMGIFIGLSMLNP